MRKILLILALLLMSGLHQAFATGNYNLQFFDSIALDNDTAYIGNSYSVYVYIKNQGPDTFDGKIAFTAYVTTKNDLNKSNPQYTFVLDSNGPNHYIIPPHGRATYVKSIVFTKTDFTVDSTNIIIIWPSGSGVKKPSLLVDNYTADNFANPYQVFFVSGSASRSSASSAASTSGMNMTTGIPSVSYYPNPTSSAVSVAIDAPQDKSTLRLMDMSGKLINEILVNANTKLYTLNLSLQNELIPNGIYIIRYETPSGIITRKLIISR